MTWVRSAMILMGIGYATDKLAALDALHGVRTALRVYGHALGLLVVVGGVAVAAAALPRYLAARARIESAHFSPHPWADLALVGALAAAALVVLILLTVAR